MASENAKTRGYVHHHQIEASKKEKSHRVKPSNLFYPGFRQSCQAFALIFRAQFIHVRSLQGGRSHVNHNITPHPGYRYRLSWRGYTRRRLK